MRLHLLLTCCAWLAAQPLAAAEWTWTYADDTAAVAHAIAADGSTILVGNGPDDMHVVTRLDPDGAIDWRREFPTAWTLGALTTLELGDDRACLYGGDRPDAAATQAQYIACYRLADGELLTRFELDRLTRTGADPDQTFTMLLADGGFVNLTARSSGFDNGGNPLRAVRHRRFTSTGAVLHDVVLGTRGYREVEGRRTDGAILFQSDLFVREYRAVDADGAPLFTLDSDLTLTNAAFAPDGSIYLLGLRPAAGRAYEWRQYDAAGRPVSRSSLESCQTCFGAIRTFSGEFTFDRGQVLLHTEYLVDDGTFGQRTERFLARLSPSYFEQRLFEPLSARVDPATNAPLALSDAGYKVGVRALDPATGRQLRTRFLGTCVDCSVVDLRVGDDGTLRVVARSTGAAATRRLSVYALADAYAERPRTRLDQAGLRGAWYAPYTPGQGFVVDHIPGTNTLFVPWFTYGNYFFAPDDSPAGLRWYSLQGEAPANATRATLAIVENTNGAFLDLPETQPRAVGSATLEAHDCDSATLEYVLNGERRTISLTRLTPATEPCVLADGTTRGTRAAASGGFDARQSGTWFVPGRSGQGLMLSVQPGGLFFGAWFTYDPTWRADDSTAQHWFSLQGDLAAATDGRATLAILRTTGGTRDGASRTTTVPVGAATIRFTACDRATLDYRFDDGEPAGGFSHLAGTVALQKIGGCSP